MSDRLLAVLEAALFVSPEPLQPAQLARALGETPETIAALADSLAAELAKPQHGMMLRTVAGGYQLVTKPEHHQELRDLLENLPPPAPLSRAAVETAAIIAYKQPITAAELESIRGVRNRESLRTLLKRKIIVPAGRARTRGHPVQYKTTKRFLVEFGLQSLDELPSLDELKQRDHCWPPICSTDQSTSGQERGSFS
jgi:segregation and condensation protein B